MTTNDEMREREASDAPVHYGSDEASAWANGYNAALADIQSKAVSDEQSKPRRAVYRDSDGDQWRDIGDGHVVLIAHRGEHTFDYSTPQDKATIDREYGPLVEVSASHKASA